MPGFDLLPIEYRKKPITIRRILFLSLLAILILLIIKYAFIIPIQNKKEALQQLSILRGRSGGYADLDETLFLQEATLEELERRLLGFQEMDEGLPGYWINTIDTLIESLPLNASLSQFTCENNYIILSGTSKSDRTSAAYMRSLSESGLFSEVSMMKIIYLQNNEIHFTIKCILNYEMEKQGLIGGDAS